MNESDVLACQFGNWFPAFEKVTFKSKVLTIPEEVAQYLLQDGMEDIPGGRDDCSSVSSGWDESRAVENSDGSDNVRNDSTPNDSDNEDDNTEKITESLVFKQFEEEVNSAIKELKGVVLPKLNWSCPKDACWMAPLQCHNFADICM